MIYYPSLSTIQVAAPFTGSVNLKLFLTAVNYDRATSVSVASAPVGKYNQSFQDVRTVNIPNGNGTNSKPIICTVRNPYARFAVRWLRNTKERTGQGLTPFTFSEWITEYNNNHWVAPLLPGGLWEKVTTNVADFQFGQITSQITNCSIDLNNILFIHYENFQNEVRNIQYIDLARPAQAAAFNEYIVAFPPTEADYSNWKSLYTADLANKVYTAFVGDFVTFGYTQNSWQ